MNYGYFACPLIALHGHDATALGLAVGRSRTVSHLALVGLRTALRVGPAHRRGAALGQSGSGFLPCLAKCLALVGGQLRFAGETQPS
jgi:hypothetical protein